MATLTLDGIGTVTVDDSFRSLAPADQERTVNEIAASLAASKPPQSAPVSSLEGASAVATAPAQHMQIEHGNTLPAAQQGTTPTVDAYKKLVSAEVFESDAGDIQYRDPTSGRMLTTDQARHVVLRDPADNRLKVFGRSSDTNESGIVGASRVLAPGLLAGAPTARAGLAPANVRPTASDIMSTSKPYYRAFHQEASQLDATPEAAAEIGERIRGALKSANFIPELAQPVYSAVGILDKGEPITLESLQSVKRVIGRAFSSPDKNVRDAAGVASAEIGKIIAQASPTAGANLKTGDQIFSTAKSVQDLQRKEAVADLRAGRAGYGGNAVNSMRQVLSPIVQRAVEGRVTGFKPDEIQAMRNIVEGDTATNVLRGVGQLSPSKGIFQTLGAAGATATLGPAALAIPALGAASNKLATILTGRQIELLKEVVAQRSPTYAEALAKAVARYERAQAGFVSDPSPARFTGLLTASRTLSTNLSRDGIAISSGDLLRVVQGPVGGRTEGEQPEPIGVFDE